MVRRLFHFVYQELQGVHYAALFLALSAVGSVVLALFRDRLLATTFGAGKDLDIYFAAFRIPDIVYTLTLFLTASTALIPVFLAEREKGGKNAQELLGSVLSFFLLTAFLMITVAFFLIPVFVPVLAPGFTEPDRARLIVFSRILLLSPLLLGLSNLASGVVQSYRRFFVYALSPIFYNAGIILGITVFYRFWGFWGLAWGVVAGALMHLAVQLPVLFFLRSVPRPAFIFWGNAMRRVITLSLPRTLGLSMNQAVFFIITALASTIGAGSIAVFNLAYNLQSVPLSVVGLSYSVAVFPTLARSFVAQQRREFLAVIATALRHMAFWLVPSAALIIVLRAHIVRVILGAGVFGWLDTRLTAAAMGMFAFSLLPQSIVLLLVRSFYAAGKTKTPLILNAIASALTLLLSLGFLRLLDASVFFRGLFGSVLRVHDIASMDMLVFPLAFSLGGFFNAALLLWRFRESFGAIGSRMGTSFAIITTGAVIMGGSAYGILQVLVYFFDTSTFLGILLQGLGAGATGFAAGQLFLRAAHNKEQRELIELVRKKIRRVSIVTPEPEKLP